MPNWPENITEMSIDKAWQWRAELSVIWEDLDEADQKTADEHIESLTRHIDALMELGDYPEILRRTTPTLNDWLDLPYE